jgi:3-oxoacyl-[acyl-carrier-protein] synthase-1
MTRAVHIVATGARTPVGLDSASSAAAYRAGISGVVRHQFMIDRAGEPMAGATDSSIDPALYGPPRLLALADSALKEVCEPLERVSTPPLALPLYLCLPEIRPGFTAQDAAAVQTGMFEMVRSLDVGITEVQVSCAGHAAGLSAFAVGHQRIQQGALEGCLIGGVDSYFHADTVDWLEDHLQLAGAVSRSAFVPGEGSGFCLLLSESASERLGLAGIHRVAGVGVEVETKLIKTEDVCLGVGLTAAVKEAIGGARPAKERIHAIICDINGERYRGEEWGFVCLRLSQYLDDPTGYSSPADCWGDLGAASGPLFAMLACQASLRGHSPGPRTLLWASSERGLRGAVVLDARL